MNVSKALADQLIKRKRMTDYLILKVEEEDWHGVADAAMDLREIDAKIVVLKELNHMQQEIWQDRS